MSQQVKQKSKSCLISVAHVRQYLLDEGDRVRPGQYTRVSKEVYDRLNFMLAKLIETIVYETDPSKRTIT